MGISTIENFSALFKSHKCERIYFKILKDNDNSKNQIYFGSDFSALQIFKNLSIQSDQKNSKILKSRLNFFWITEANTLSQAPNAQLIFYPQYPEVRFSGFLKGCKSAPADIMSERKFGRTLIFGIEPNGTVIAIALDQNHPISKKLRSGVAGDDNSVFHIFGPNREASTNKDLLLQKLLEIYKKNWVPAIRLNGRNEIVQCKGTNCGGYTLEALLEIKNNGISEPDYLGWEIKQFASANFDNPRGGAVTLFTPEPDSGVYTEKGVEFFIRKYGYPDKAGRENRINVSSPHKFGVKNPNTALTLALEGYDTVKNKLLDVGGGIVLLDSKENVAAKWDFKNLMSHWNRKHNQAAYVPSLCKSSNGRANYRYGHKIYLGEGTDFLLFLKACALSQIVYDPGIKLEIIGGKVRTKRRSQFRISFKQLSQLYHTWVENTL